MEATKTIDLEEMQVQLDVLKKKISKLEKARKTNCPWQLFRVI